MKLNERISSKPGKQRKAAINAPLHARASALNCNLAKDLRAKEKKRSARLKKGDKVRVTRGKFKKRSGAVTHADLKSGTVFVEGVLIKKQNGKEIPAPLHPSNLVIIEVKSGRKEEKKPAKKKEAAEEKKEEKK